MDSWREHVKEIERKILEAIVQGLERKQLLAADIPEIANFVLAKVAKCNSHNELISGLDELSQKWPIFKGILQLEQGEIAEAKEDSAEEEVLRLAKTGQVDAAINLAKSFTEK